MKKHTIQKRIYVPSELFGAFSYTNNETVCYLHEGSSNKLLK